MITNLRVDLRLQWTVCPPPAALYSAALKLPPRPACLPRVVAPDVARGAAIATLFQHKIPPFPP